MSTRTVRVDKAKLIAQIKANKAKHIEEYNQAVIDYKEEADKKLRELRRDLNAGKTDLQLIMTEPVNKADEYDKLVTQFEWEEDQFVSLSQQEFAKFVHDEFDFAIQSRMSNFTYSKFK